MFCPNCGCEIEEGTAFCPQCGQGVEGASASQPVASTPVADSKAAGSFEPAAESTPTISSAPEPASASKPDPKTHRRRNIIIAIAVALAVVAVGAGGALWWKTDSDAKAAFESSHSMHAVIIPVSAPGFDSADTRVPVQVTGTDLDGSAVDLQSYIGADGSGLELQQGDYVITVEASPLTDDGTVYAVPATSIQITLGSDLESGQALQVDESAAIKMDVVPALDVTEAQINAAADYAGKDAEGGKDAATLETYKQAAVSKRDDAIAQEQAVEAAAAAQAAAEQEAAARKAALHVETSAYSFDLPDYWYGKVRVSTSGTTTQVFMNDYAADPLFSVSVVPASYPNNAGDIGGGRIGAVDAGSQRIEMWQRNWLYLAWEAKFNPTTSEHLPSQSIIEEGIDLSTGGAKTYADITKDTSSCMGSTDYYQAVVLPTIVAR